jgi:redox-sensitive bicupin YhaK (pirin superfamily)
MAELTAPSIRRIAKIFTAHRQREGAGFIVSRPFPSRNLADADTDPFLLLDALGPTMVDHRSPGAPWHPHRGFDTVTYFKRGSGGHQDSMGNKGVVREGEVQWMRAASGVIHDEGHPGITRNDAPRPSEGFQLWVNLPAALKMSAPDYRHLTAETFVWRDYAVHGATGTKVKVIAGELGEEAAGLRSPLTDALAVPVLYADVDMAPGGKCHLPIPDGMQTALLYVYRGAARVFNGAKDGAGGEVRRGDCVVYDTSDGGARVEAMEGDEYPPYDPAAEPTTTEELEEANQKHHGVSFLLLAGRRIGEPIARQGPFVMNTEAEIEQAFRDYQRGTLATTKATETRY